MPATLLLRSSDFEVVRDGAVLEVRKRMGPLAVVVALAIVMAGIFWFVGGLLSTYRMAALGLFLRGAAGLVAFFGGVTLVGGLAMALSPKLRMTYQIDGFRRLFSSRTRSVPLESVRLLGPAPFVGNYWGLFLEVDGTRTMLLTVAEGRKRELEQVNAEVAGLLGDQGNPGLPMAAVGAADSVSDQLATLILLVMGGAWSMLGYFFFDGLFFMSSHGGGPRIPVWTAGLLFIAIGAWRAWRQRSRA